MNTGLGGEMESEPLPEQEQDGVQTEKPGGEMELEPLPRLDPIPHTNT